LKALTASLVAVCVCATARIHADVCEPFVVKVHLQVDRSIRSRVIPADLKNETEVLWMPYGVDLQWTDSPDPAAAPGGLSLEVVLERRIIDQPGLPTWGTVLGLASLKRNAPSPRPIRVSVDATESVLSLRATGRIVRDHELGRALGRVLAHEIGHVLLGAPFHDDVGLMRAAFRPDQLADPDRAPFRLTCTGVTRLKGRISVLSGIEHELIDPEACVQGRPVQ
jgi:hypothetical protein